MSDSHRAKLGKKIKKNSQAFWERVYVPYHSSTRRYSSVQWCVHVSEQSLGHHSITSMTSVRWWPTIANGLWGLDTYQKGFLGFCWIPSRDSCWEKEKNNEVYIHIKKKRKKKKRRREKRKKKKSGMANLVQADSIGPPQLSLALGGGHGLEEVEVLRLQGPL